MTYNVFGGTLNLAKSSYVVTRLLNLLSYLLWRGQSRARPFKYNSQLCFFTQRWDDWLEADIITELAASYASLMTRAQFIVPVAFVQTCCLLLYPPSEWNETGGDSVFTFMCVCVCVCVCVSVCACALIFRCKYLENGL